MLLVPGLPLKARSRRKAPLPPCPPNLSPPDEVGKDCGPAILITGCSGQSSPQWGHWTEQDGWPVSHSAPEAACPDQTARNRWHHMVPAAPGETAWIYRREQAPLSGGPKPSRNFSGSYAAIRVVTELFAPAIAGSDRPLMARTGMTARERLDAMSRTLLPGRIAIAAAGARSTTTSAIAGLAAARGAGDAIMG